MILWATDLIMKVNPEMMPVMVAAVEKDGSDSLALTEYVKSSLEGDIESLEGVASVESSGEVEGKRAGNPASGENRSGEPESTGGCCQPVPGGRSPAAGRTDRIE